MPPKKSKSIQQNIVEESKHGMLKAPIALEPDQKNLPLYLYNINAQEYLVKNAKLIQIVDQQMKQIDKQQKNLLFQKLGIDEKITTSQLFQKKNSDHLLKVYGFIKRNGFILPTDEFMEEVNEKGKSLDEANKLAMKLGICKPKKGSEQEESKQQKPSRGFMQQNNQLFRRQTNILVDDRIVQRNVHGLKQVYEQYLKSRKQPEDYQKMTEEASKLIINAARSNQKVIVAINNALQQYKQQHNSVQINFISDQSEEQIDTSRQKINNQMIFDQRPDNIQDQIISTSQQVRIIGGMNSSADLIQQNYGQNRIDSKFQKPTSRQADNSTVENKQVGLHIGLGDPQSKESRVADALNIIWQKYKDDDRVQQEISFLQEMLNISVFDRQDVVNNQIQDDSDQEQNVNNDQNAIYANQHNQGFLDLEENLEYQAFINDLNKQAQLNPDQAKLSRIILSDPRAILKNLGNVQAVQTYLNVNKDAIANLTARFANVVLFDDFGAKYTVGDLLQNIPKIIQQISKIVGDIDFTLTDLKEYRPQIDVFSTAIVKKETNRFKMRSGQAFMTRSCC